MRKLLYLGSLLSLFVLLNTNISIAKDNYNGYKKQYKKSGQVKYPNAKKDLKRDYYNKKFDHVKSDYSKHDNHNAYNNSHKRHNDHDYYTYKSNHNGHSNYNKKHYDHDYYYNKSKHKGNNHYVKRHYHDDYRINHKHYYNGNKHNHHASNNGYLYFNLFPHLLGYFSYWQFTKINLVKW